MKWTIKLVVEVVPGNRIKHEVGTIEPSAEFSAATAGLTRAEAKALLAACRRKF
jgi:hypothetical protein